MYKISLKRRLIANILHIPSGVADDLVNYKGYEMVTPNLFVKSIESFMDQINHKLNHDIPVTMTVLSVNGINNILIDNNDRLDKPDELLLGIKKFILNHKSEYGNISIASIDGQLVSITLDIPGLDEDIKGSDIINNTDITVYKTDGPNKLKFKAKMSPYDVRNNRNTIHELKVIGLLSTEEI